MKVPDKEFDFVIVGSGLGGLECGQILASEGHSVIVLEKNHQIGGNLQVFSRDKNIFDTGIHYIGSLDEGESMSQVFKYLGIWDKLKLRRMDETGFEVIQLANGNEYKYGQGYDKLKANLYESFPNDTEAIDTFCDRVIALCEEFPMYHLRYEEDNFLQDISMLEENAYDYICSITDNEELRNVLAATNPLYGGEKEKTPLYVHALIFNSYIKGSYRLEDGASQVAIQIAKKIREYGGMVLKRKKVVGANYHENSKLIKEVVLDTGEVIKGKNFISNLHPSVTIDIFGKDKFLKVYRNRIQKLENSVSTFILHLSFKKKSFPYLNYNIYKYYVDDVWQPVKYDLKGDWPEMVFISTAPSSIHKDYCDSMAIMTYMKASDFEEWQSTFNTVTEQGERGETYKELKKKYEERILHKVREIFPDIDESIIGVYSSSPLTFRDYLGTEDGSAYGILKDSASYMRTHLNTKSKVPNLYLTGQNIGLHGVLGVTITALLTCFNFVDKKELLAKINNA